MPSSRDAVTHVRLEGESPNPRAAMKKIRSSGRLPKPKALDPDTFSSDHFDESEDRQWWSPIDEEARRYEETLPGAGDDCWYHGEPDAYDDAWDRIRGWREELEDDPDWTRQGQDPCRRCGEYDFVDPLGTCGECRAADHRCRWCGLDRFEYRGLQACRTCYQRLRRSTVTGAVEQGESMMKAAFLRHDLRKRRSERRRED